MAWCSDDDGAGERDKWAFDVSDSPISPTRDSSSAVGPCFEVVGFT